MIEQAQDELNCVGLDDDRIELGPSADDVHLLNSVVEFQLRVHELFRALGKLDSHLLILVDSLLELVDELAQRCLVEELALEQTDQIICIYQHREEHKS